MKLDPTLLELMRGWKLDERSSGKGPRYMRLAQELQQAIEQGAVPAGTKLPSERVLARELSLSRGTVVAAYNELRERNLVEARQGSGTRVSVHYGGTRDLGLPAGGRELESHISFAMANPPALRSVREAVAQLGPDELDAPLSGHGYASFGLEALRRTIAGYHTRQGLPTTSDQVLVTTGAQQALSLVAEELVSPGDTVVMEDPTYSGAIGAFRAARAAIVPIPIGPEGVDVEALRSVVAGTPPRVAYLVPVHNPTGTVTSAETWRQVAELAQRFDLTIVEDRTLSQITFERPAPVPLATLAPPERIVLVESISKIFWGGLRVGWVRAPRALIARLVERKAGIDLASPVLSQIVATRLIAQIEQLRGSFNQLMAQRLERLLALLEEHLPSWRYSRPAGGLSLWIRLPTGDGAQFLQVARQYGVTAAPGAMMSAGANFSDHVRLAYVHSPTEMEEGVRRLARAWTVYERAARSEPRFSMVS